MRDRQWVPITMLGTWIVLCFVIAEVQGSNASGLQGSVAGVVSVAVIGGIAYARRRRARVDS